ncbi:hypothetical protein IW145_004371, partial [Coemansia sp. RSA 521]
MTMMSLMTHTDFLNSDPRMMTGTMEMMVPHMETVTVLAYLKVVILLHRMMDTALETTTVTTPPHMTTDTVLMMKMLFLLMVVIALAKTMTTTYLEDSVIRYDDYSADRGDSITVYDNTFYTAANRSPTPHPTPRPQFRQFKERENHRAENRNTAILFPETLECRPSAVASRALTRQVFDTEETDPADG